MSSVPFALHVAGSIPTAHTVPSAAFRRMSRSALGHFLCPGSNVNHSLHREVPSDIHQCLVAETRTSLVITLPCASHPLWRLWSRRWAGGWNINLVMSIGPASEPGKETCCMEPSGAQATVLSKTHVALLVPRARLQAIRKCLLLWKLPQT